MITSLILTTTRWGCGASYATCRRKTTNPNKEDFVLHRFHIHSSVILTVFIPKSTGVSPSIDWGRGRGTARAGLLSLTGPTQGTAFRQFNLSLGSLVQPVNNLTACQEVRPPPSPTGWPQYFLTDASGRSLPLGMCHRCSVYYGTLVSVTRGVLNCVDLCTHTLIRDSSPCDVASSLQPGDIFSKPAQMLCP